MGSVRRSAATATVLAGALVVGSPVVVAAESSSSCHAHKVATGDGRCLPDHDRDGLADQAERKSHGTDPKRADTDSDGIEDGLEKVLGGP